jgi:hypothetical protein
LVPAVIEAAEVRYWQTRSRIVWLCGGRGLLLGADWPNVRVPRSLRKFDGTAISRNRRILAAKPTAAAFIDLTSLGAIQGIS